MCGHLYHFAPCRGQNDTVHGAKWYSKTFSHLRFKYSRRSTEITINTIKQFIMLYMATEIWLNTNSFLNFLSHICYHSCFMFCHGAKWYSWPPFLTFWKIKWYFSDKAVSFNFLVIGIDSFDKKYLENDLKRSQIWSFQTVSFCPNHAVSFCPSELLFTVLATIQKYDTPQ